MAKAKQPKSSSIEAYPRFKVDKFETEASKNSLLYHCLRDLNIQLTEKHRETVASLKANPYDRDLQSAVRLNKRYVCAILNVMNLFKSIPPLHFPRQAQEALKVTEIMMEIKDSIYSERAIRQQGYLQSLLEVAEPEKAVA